MTEFDGTEVAGVSRSLDYRLVAPGPYLGEIGSVVMLAYRNLASDITTSELQRWCEPLQAAIFGIKKLPPVEKSMLSPPRNVNRLKTAEWRKSGDWGYGIEPKPAGLDFRVQSFGLRGEGWCATLTVIYEVMTDTFVHHLLSTNSSNQVSDDLVLYLIGETFSTVSDKLQAQHAEAAPPISVRLLYAVGDGQTSKSYQTALQRLRQHSDDEPMSASWLRRHKTKIPAITAEHVVVMAIEPFSVRYNTARECHNFLVRMAASYKAGPIPRQLPKRYPATWKSLSPLKSNQIKPKNWAVIAAKEKRDKDALLKV